MVCDTNRCTDDIVQRAMRTSGADIQFHRPNRLDVCLVQNHHMAL